MSCFIYLDSDLTPVGVQRFDSAPGVEITSPQNTVYVEDASSVSDIEILERWRFKNNVLTDVGQSPSGAHKWNTETGQWVPDVARAKADKLKEIHSIRGSKEYGGFSWDGSLFDSDPQSQLRIQGGVSLAQMALANNQPFSIDWTLQDNTVRTLNGTEMIGVGLALANHVTTLHGISRILKQQVDAASTLQEVEAIQWPG